MAHDPATDRWDLLTDQDLAEPMAGASSTEQPQSPSYLAWHPDGRHVYAVGEVSDGQVWALTVARGGHGLAILGSAPTGGAHPCHLAVDPSGRVLLTANYTSGSLAVHRLQPDGRIGALTQQVQHEGSGPHPDRQRGPHAHMVHIVDETLVLAVDLGADLIAAYRLDAAAATLAPLASSSLPAGFGPRHLVALDHDRVVVAGELTGEIALLRLDPATGRLELLDLQRGSDVTERAGRAERNRTHRRRTLRADGQSWPGNRRVLPGARADHPAGRRDPLRRRPSARSHGGRRPGVRGQPGERRDHRAARRPGHRRTGRHRE